MNFDYSFVLEMYQEMLDRDSIFVLISGLKVVGVVFVIIVWYGRYLEALKAPDDDKTSNVLPITPKDIVTGFGTILLIGFYDQILDLLDGFFATIENFYTELQQPPKDLGMTGTGEIGEATDKDWQDMLKDMATHIQYAVTDPSYIIVQGIKGIAWFIDLIIYAVFLAERFFAMGILRILGGIALAVSYHSKLSKWFWNWLGIYTAVWLLIIPYMLINVFTNVIYETTHQQLMIQATVMPGAYSPMIVVVLFIIWLKIKLYSASKDLVYKIFN